MRGHSSDVADSQEMIRAFLSNAKALDEQLQQIEENAPESEKLQQVTYTCVLGSC